MKSERELIETLATLAPERIPFDYLARRAYRPLLECYAEAYDGLPDSRPKMVALRGQSLRNLTAALGSACPEARPTAFNIYEDRTSGSTGRPKQVLRSALSLQREMLRLNYLLDYYAKATASARPKVIVFVSHYLGRSGFYYRDSTIADLHLFKVPIWAGGSSEALAEHLDAHPGQFVLTGTASSLSSFVTRMGKCCVRPGLILASGEQLPSEIRLEIESAMCASAFCLYVMTEFGVMGFECFGCGRYHLLDGDLLFRNARDGHLLVTDTTNTCQPFVDYNTGDICMIEDPRGSVCAGGWPRTHGLLGRPYGKAHLPV
jgi:phenylacetate-coenzyme A ligase PaaK-like adenylate-forming protein